MADDLELVLRSMEGESPSPDFVANLRELVAAEIAEPKVAADDEFFVTVDLATDERESTMTRTRWMLAGIAAAAIALVAGIVTLSGDPDDTVVETVTASDEPTAFATLTPDAPTPVPATPQPETSDAQATPLPSDFASIQSGTYRVEADFAPPFTFTIDLSLFMQENRGARVALSSPASEGPGDLGIDFMALASLWDPARIVVQGDGPTPEDFDSWLDTLGDGLVAGSREEVSRGDLVIKRVDLQLDTSSCEGGPDSCLDVATSETGLAMVVTPGSRYRIWVVEKDGQAAMAVIASIADEADSVWFDAGERIVSSLAFDAAATNE